jgi:hypothetical protein
VPGFDSRQCKIYPVATGMRPTLGLTQPPVQLQPAAIFLEVEWQGHRTDHSLPTSAEVKITWIYSSTPPYVFME